MTLLTIRRLASLATPEGNAALAGPAQGKVRRVTNAAIRVEDGTITFAGSDDEYVARFGDAPAPGETALDGRGKTALPGFVDPHTHLPWAGFRESEFNERLKGRTRRPFRLLVVGQRARDWEQAMPVPVTAIDLVKDDHLLALLYSAADVFVHPALADNLPNGVLESLACGTPVVAFEVGGVGEAVR
ncbi:glycosyltransferase, partial [Acidobacteria bacterium ACD]|nr:glycosyltransferase [Acidobacteria bacterium ACD]